jgi:hypothetical protein
MIVSRAFLPHLPVAWVNILLADPFSLITNPQIFFENLQCIKQCILKNMTCKFQDFNYFSVVIQQIHKLMGINNIHCEEDLNIWKD